MNDDDTIVTKVSPFTVADTIRRLLAEIAARNMKVFAVIDHSGEAHGAGLDLRDTKVVIFGSPVAGTPVMAAAPLAALDLPLKVLSGLIVTPQRSATQRRTPSRLATS